MWIVQGSVPYMDSSKHSALHISSELGGVASILQNPVCVPRTVSGTLPNMVVLFHVTVMSHVAWQCNITLTIAHRCQLKHNYVSVKKTYSCRQWNVTQEYMHTENAKDLK